MRRTLILGGLLALLSAGVSHAGISVDHDKAADFSRYETFTLIEATEAVDPLMRKRLIDAVEAELGADGLTKAAEGADLEVYIYATTDQRMLITGDDWGYGGHPGWPG